MELDLLKYNPVDMSKVFVFVGDFWVSANYS